MAILYGTYLYSFRVCSVPLGQPDLIFNILLNHFIILWVKFYISCNLGINRSNVFLGYCRLNLTIAPKFHFLTYTLGFTILDRENSQGLSLKPQRLQITNNNVKQQTHKSIRNSCRRITNHSGKCDGNENQGCIAQINIHCGAEGCWYNCEMQRPSVALVVK